MSKYTKIYQRLVVDLEFKSNLGANLSFSEILAIVVEIDN